jgi:hypothetical protein
MSNNQRFLPHLVVTLTAVGLGVFLGSVSAGPPSGPGGTRGADKMTISGTVYGPSGASLPDIWVGMGSDEGGSRPTPTPAAPTRWPSSAPTGSSSAFGRRRGHD